MLLIRRLRLECVDSVRFSFALETISTLLRNVLEHPEDEKYRTVRLGNVLFQQRVGAFAAGLDLLRCFGFEDASTADAQSVCAPVTHLALPTFDAAELARGLVLLTASKEAVALNERGEEGPGDAPAVGAAYTRAEGKRPASAAPSCGTARPAVGSSAAAPAHPETLPELSDFSAEGLDSFFAAHAGDECAQLFGSQSEARFEALAQAAVEATRVAAGESAQRAAARWVALLAEHGALMGWHGEGAPEEADDEDGDEPGVAGGEQFDVGEDGNFEACAECGHGGELICCEGCPHVYHPACLGPFAPSADDDGDWFCPQCSKGLGI